MNIPITITTLLAGMMLSVGKAGGQLHSDDVTINIRFLPVQTIAVQTSQETIDLVYAPPEDYEYGVTVNQDDYLTVFSSGGFQVTVAADDAHFVTPAPIIESEDGGRELKYNVTYDNQIAGAANKYINKYVKGDGLETVYHANVTYTITTR